MVRIPRQSFIAPTVLVATYFAVGWAGLVDLPALQLILATLAYMIVIWARNIFLQIRNVHEETLQDRLILGGGIGLFALCSLLDARSIYA